MPNRILPSLLFLFIAATLIACKRDTIKPALTGQIEYTFPEESELHEATWLQWPHQYQYGKTFRDELDPTWVAMTKALITSEQVNLIVYNQTEKERVENILKADQVSLSNVRFHIYKTDDFWTRDNGPIYVHDQNGELVIQDWGFNGWGGKVGFKKCNKIPCFVAKEQKLKRVDLTNVMINEGGSVEMDGKGTLMACKSSILNENRNPGMTQKQAEEIFTQFLGVSNFVWLEGQAGLEITDQHIDGFARFGNASTIVTMDSLSLLEFDVLPSDIEKLYAAKNKEGQAYDFLKLPLTAQNVRTTNGTNLGYKGSYCNYYIGNTVVLVPTYNDENDNAALEMIQDIYPNRSVIGIDCRDVYQYGGMIHCVTQQQPAK